MCKKKKEKRGWILYLKCENQEAMVVSMGTVDKWDRGMVLNSGYGGYG